MPKQERCVKCSLNKKGVYGAKCSFRNRQPQFDGNECAHFREISSNIDLGKDCGSMKFETYDDYYTYARQQWSSSVITKEVLVNLLVEKGMSKSGATALANTIANGYIANEQEHDSWTIEDADDKGTKDMILGALWCVGGAVATVISYSSASAGGHYYIWWGAILFGGIQFLKGLSKNLS